MVQEEFMRIGVPITGSSGELCSGVFDDAGPSELLTLKRQFSISG